MRFWHTLLASIATEGPDAAVAMMKTWFGGTWPPRRDAIRFIGWTIYNSVDLDTSQREVAERIASGVESAVGRPWAMPTTEARPVMTYTAEDIADCHRPLIWYLLLQSAHRGVDFLMRHCGFELRHVTDVGTGRHLLSYWCRHALPGASVPVVFLHGVMGFVPYVLTLYQLATSHKGILLLPVFPAACIAAPLRHWHRDAALPVDDLVGALRIMISRHSADGQLPRAAWFAHSLGTAVLASVLKQAPELAVGAVFSDPICFDLASGDVLRNFLYARPALKLRNWYHLIQVRAAARSGCWLACVVCVGPCAPCEACKVRMARGSLWAKRHRNIHTQGIFVSGEPSIQFCFRRAFWWSHGWLHPNDLPCDALIVLSGHDTVVRQLESNQMAARQ